jgi:hypothetical protein
MHLAILLAYAIVIGLCAAAVVGAFLWGITQIARRLFHVELFFDGPLARPLH